jgi:fucose 4-O-acetylase-like acetyltransferase
MIQKRLDHLDIARGIAIILVVWGHADRRMDPAFYHANLELTGEVIYAFHVALLFIISGALLRGMVERNDLSHILSRITRSTLVPFLSLSSAFMVLNLLVPKGLLATPTLLEMLQGIFLYQSSEWAPSGVLWFLFVVFTGTALTAVLYKYLRLSFVQVLVVAVVIKLCSPLVEDVHFWAVGKFARNYVFLVFGIFLADRIKDDRFESRDLVIMCGAVVAFIPFFLAMNTFKPFFQLMTGMLGSLAVLKLSAMAVKFKLPLLKFFKYCGVNSILIFVFHMPFFTLVRPVILKLGLQHSFFGFGIWVFLGCLLPLAMGLALQQIPVIYALLLGRKPVTNISIFRGDRLVKERS